MAREPTIEDVPILYNWRRWEETKAGTTTEYIFYTDVDFSGLTATCGPYTFYNTLARPRAVGSTAPGLVLRYVESREATRTEVRLKTDTKGFSGGWLVEDLAALAALLLSARVEPGGQSRVFPPWLTDDPLGRPIATEASPPPTFHPRNSQLVAPGALGFRKVEQLLLLSHLPSLDPVKVIALIRSARLFQDALWLVEQEAQLSWLMLVSAIEGAATVWRGSQASPSDRLSFSRPELAKRLRQAGGEGLLEEVAEDVADSLGATRKFVEFCVEFLPAPPATRPAQAFQVQWDDEFWLQALKKIYGYRSKALHVGTPFPPPMCRAPFVERPGALPNERGTIGLAESTMGATWNAKDLPVSLNTFVYFAGAVLVNWLKHAGSRSPVSPRKHKLVGRFANSLRQGLDQKRHRASTQST